MQLIPPNKDMVKTTDEILAQTRLILQQNLKIIDAICHPAIVISEREGAEVKFIIAKPGQILYEK